MLRSTHVAQDLTFLMDSQGADPAAVMELLPEELTAEVQRSEQAPPRAISWGDASEDLADSLRFLVERDLVRITKEGRAVTGAAVFPACDGPRPFSPDEREEGFGFVPLFEWDMRVGLPEHTDPFDFESPRRES